MIDNLDWNYIEDMPLNRLSTKYPNSNSMSLLYSKAVDDGADPNDMCSVFKSGNQHRKIELDGKRYICWKGKLFKNKIKEQSR